MTGKQPHIEIKMAARKRIALVAHDNKKLELIEWATRNRAALAVHDILATGTTGRVIETELGLKVKRVYSGPIGGDQQIGARIAEGEIDFLVFFWDPIAPKPHDPDVKALLRMATIWNILVACNPSSADFIINALQMRTEYARRVPDYSDDADSSLASDDPLSSWKGIS